MQNCKEICRKIASDEYAEATGWERLVVRFHLWRCKNCRCYEEQLRAMGASMAQLLHEDPPAATTLERIERAILENNAAGSHPSSADPGSDR
ncbi:MAG: hypothetical protein IH849_03770 [Acidobacteria bacterium]|nr:hypothetical protein [Acidobacteriota bacterium]